jgi:hypothetical protein
MSVVATPMVLPNVVRCNCTNKHNAVTVDQNGFTLAITNFFRPV